MQVRALQNRQSAVVLAILAAVCYGFSVPLSKLLLESVPSVLLAALLYLGAGLGMTAIRLLGRRRAAQTEAKLTRRDLPYTAAMIALDIAAPILLLLGLSQTSAGSVSLLGNFEIAATSVIALLFFHESVGKRMWMAIAVVTLACLLLSIEDFRAFSVSAGSLCVLLACVCWGLENNCTRMLSLKDPMQIVILKGFGAGGGSLIAAFALGQGTAPLLPIALSLLLGFAAYGLSIYFYIRAQRHLGAARTSAYYAFAPFIGAALSAALFGQPVTLPFCLALLLMIAGAVLAVREKHSHPHRHERMEHEHRHSHTDGHHGHTHPFEVRGEHSHPHVHEALEHAHPHTPDLHHRHPHKAEETKGR
jgi:drug/metabolite transporter (DMT)-like permease